MGEHADARVRLAREYLRGVIGRAVVDDDEFPVIEGLTEDTVDRSLQGSCTVVGSRDDGDHVPTSL
jgi:hypothetical protein